MWEFSAGSPFDQTISFHKKKHETVFSQHMITLPFIFTRILTNVYVLMQAASC